MYLSRGITRSKRDVRPGTPHHALAAAGAREVGRILVVSSVVYCRMYVVGLGGRRASMNGYSAQCNPDIKACVNRHSTADRQASQSTAYPLPDRKSLRGDQTRVPDLFYILTCGFLACSIIYYHERTLADSWFGRIRHF